MEKTYKVWVGVVKETGELDYVTAHLPVYASEKGALLLESQFPETTVRAATLTIHEESSDA